MRREATALLTLGLGFLASGFLTMGAAYAIRILVLHTGGVEAAGIYQAAWTIGGLYAGFILQAMGTDFYPRLTAASGTMRSATGSSTNRRRSACCWPVPARRHAHISTARF